ncbi:TTD14-like protein [Mya arenaria]|uniref:TTD14-like protein n=1 Tax=Mya arenaria TaxID=6604 RepID=A0ABY7E742_MYAAR|nr:TTD14-like protein [Mya arenaria]
MQFRWFVSLRNARGVPEVNRVVRKIPRMSQDIGDNKNKVYKVVLTGAYKFQENLIKSMMQIENTYFDLAQTCQKNCLVICDRGIMDGSACSEEFPQVIHMVSSACGAEAFYTCAGHKTRHEDIDVARNLDKITAQAWVGHPYYDVVDNSTDFDDKINRMINVSVWTYTHTIRRPEINKQSVEMRMAINVKDYNILLNQKDENHATIQKQRRCFLWKNQYFQMDIYREPCPDK